MQEDIQKLQHGQGAQLSYNSSRLRVSGEIDLGSVERILKSDGARLVMQLGPQSDAENDPYSSGTGSSHAHGHEHGHGEGRLMKWLLSISALLYLAAFFLEDKVPGAVLVSAYAAVMVLSGHTTFIRGLRNLGRFKFNMDTLMTVALIGAIAIGEWREAALVAILFGVNEMLEGYGMNRARQSLSALLDAAPKEAELLRDGVTVRVPIDSLSPGDIVRVRPGEKIPSDGIIVKGAGAINEAAITGESVPSSKETGAEVFGGSISTDGLLDIEISKAYQDSSLAKIMHLVQEAQDSKTPTELFIDKFAKYYTPGIMLIALAAAILPPLLFGQSWTTWLYQGLSILIVGCPCSLVLSSPIALVSGMTRAARLGILVKGGIHMEQLGRLESIAFDKTGTLTRGEPAVITEIVYDPQFYAVAGSMEQSSLHPLASAVMRYLAVKRPDLQYMDPHQPAVLPGEGITAELNGREYWVGSDAVLRHVQLSPSEQKTVAADIDRLKRQGYTLIAAASRDRVLGLFGLADEIRQEAGDVVTALHREGIVNTVMLTGDHAQSAAAIAEQSGVRSYYASLLPEQKVEHIRSLSRSGRTAMVGDGINDAPALAAADLGIAMGKGTDSAIETADVVLMQDHLGRLPAAISIGKRVNTVIRWNIAISLSLKGIALLLTIPGWLTLWIAILSDMGATILVTLLGLTILWGKKHQGIPRKRLEA
ncbi:heavy metal translocating P-type ATPase [Paenibacillus lemnae]|uniref:Cd(2+)-exporting ATPase n=1 Tax=Paenibacillus lemnae TaxID=1330551 RepID=A0A848MCK3_PAELE|nr:heavy metal translocating P-type ATPase [Paenibacillus lemnae]NMO97901.1 cadmium-translocating P-type ATPase [Paenibacillus lemnae]